MTDFLRILVVAVASLADPISLAGYIAAGAIIKRLSLSLVAGAAWAVAMIVLIHALNPGYRMAEADLAARVLGGLLATAIVFGLAEFVRRRRSAT